MCIRDRSYVKDASMSHVAARAELRELVSALELPLADRTAQDVAA